MNANRFYLSSRKLLVLILFLTLPVLLSCSLASYLGFNPTPTVAPIPPATVTVTLILESPTPELVLPTNTLELPPTEQPTETVQVVLPTETETAIPVPEFIAVENIDAVNWNFANSTKCKDQKEGCWFLSSYKQNGSLEGKDFYYIDPNWENPYLVFWQKFTSKGYSYFGFIEITADTDVGWSQVQGYKDSNFEWKEEAIDLSEYKGSEIMLRIMFVPTTDNFSAQQTAKFNEHQWAVASIRIVPNYAP